MLLRLHRDSTILATGLHRLKARLRRAMGPLRDNLPMDTGRRRPRVTHKNMPRPQARLTRDTEDRLQDNLGTGRRVDRLRGGSSTLASTADTKELDDQ